MLVKFQPHCVFLAGLLPELDYGVDAAGVLIKKHFEQRFYPELNDVGS